MRRRLYSFVTALVCLCALLPAAFAASDSPTPPGWIPEKNYVVLPGDEVYQSENWAKVLSLRAEAEAGAQLPDAGAEVADTSAGMCYETGLLPKGPTTPPTAPSARLPATGRTRTETSWTLFITP